MPSESKPSRIQRIVRSIREQPLFAAGSTLMGAVMLHATIIGIQANTEANDRVDQMIFTGNPATVARLAETNRRIFLEDIYNKKYSQEINGDVAGLVLGGLLFGGQIALSLARGRHRFNGAVV